jgi:hypothetical protein
MSDAPIKLTSSTGRAWWAPTMGRMTVKARVATVSIVAALLAITLVVWNLPGVSSLVTGEPAGPTAREAELAAENQRLAEQLQTSRAQADSLRDVLSDEQAAREKGEQARAEAQAQRDAEAADGGSAAAGLGSGSSTRSGSSSSGSKKSSSGDSPANASRPAAGAGAGAAAPAVKPTAPAKATLLDPAQRYFGMYTEQAPFNWATFDAAASSVGRSQSMVGYFGGWDEDFRANAVTRAWERGLMPMLTWESRPIGSANDVVDEPEYSLPRIIAGDFDAYLTKYAQDVVATGLPLAIRLDHEMNSIWYPWSEQTGSGASINGNSPGDYVKMWQHVHDIFEAQGANQYVIWVWSPNIINNLPSALQGIETLQGLYPGDAYVDWVGVSGYQRPPYKTDNTSTFSYTYDRTLDQLRQITDKKILLAEVGASETGGTKPAWITSFFQGFDPGVNDDVIGFAWFNLAVSTYVSGELATNDWRVTSRANTLEAFRQGIADPARNFGGTPNANAPTLAPFAAAAAAPTATASPEPTASPSPSASPPPTPPPTAAPATTPPPPPTPSPTS